MSMEWSTVEIGNTHRSSFPPSLTPLSSLSLSCSLSVSVSVFLSVSVSLSLSLSFPPFFPDHTMILTGVSSPQRHGKGRLRFVSGNVYNGEFQYNQIHGQGVMAYRNRDRYDGRWKNGMVSEYNIVVILCLALSATCQLTCIIYLSMTLW